MARPKQLTHNLTASDRAKAQYQHTYNSFKKSLERQSALGNLTPMGESLLENPRALKIHVQEMVRERRLEKEQLGAAYKSDPNYIKQNTLQFTKTGYIAKFIKGQDILKSRVRYGRETERLYKAVQEEAIKAGDPSHYTLTTKSIVSAGPGKRGVVKDQQFGFELFDIQTFVSTSSPKALIALRISLLGEEREDVLRDYGY